MAWPVPSAATLTARAGAVYAAAFPGFDATDPNSVASVTARIVGMTAFDLYLYQGYWAAELFADTAADSLDRHAGIWGITRIPAQAATGNATVAGTNGVALPSGILATDALGNSYVTTAGATISGGAATLPLSAVSGGAQGNLSSGVTLAIVSPVAGLSAQTLTVAAPGLSGGAAAETDAALRARLLARIRLRGRGGNAADYAQWAEASSSAVAYVQAVGGWYGSGSVAVFVAGAGPSALTDAEVLVVDAYLQTVRPVTARVYTLAATVTPVAVTIRLSPDTAATRAAATAAFASYMAAEASIGGALFVTGLDGAIAAGLAGAADFDRLAPLADVPGAAGVILSAGALSFSA